MKSEKQKESDRIYHKRPEVMAYQKEYYKNPDVITHRKEYQKEYYKKHHSPKISKIKLTAEEKKIKYKTNYLKNYKKKKPENFIPKHKQLRDFFLNYKKDKFCSICGYKEHTNILEFHHNSGNKEFDVSSLIHFDLIEKEIKKCILICPNCHRWLHTSKFQIKNKICSR